MFDAATVYGQWIVVRALRDRSAGCSNIVSFAKATAIGVVSVCTAGVAAGIHEGLSVTSGPGIRYRVAASLALPTVGSPSCMTTIKIVFVPGNVCPVATGIPVGRCVASVTGGYYQSDTGHTAHCGYTQYFWYVSIAIVRLGNLTTLFVRPPVH